MRGVAIAVVLATGMIVLSGCSNSVEYVPVSGTVYLDEKPLPNVMVTFQPMSGSSGDAGGVGSYATTDSNGRYKLEAMTEQPRSGAIVGKHQVRIATPPPKGESDADSASESGKKKFRDPVPPKYNIETTLTFDVPPSGTSSADFKLVK